MGSCLKYGKTDAKIQLQFIDYAYNNIMFKKRNTQNKFDIDKDLQ